MINTPPGERSKDELAHVKEACFKTIKNIFAMNWARDSDVDGNAKFDIDKYDEARALLFETFKLFEESLDY